MKTMSCSGFRRHDLATSSSGTGLPSSGIDGFLAQPSRVILADVIDISTRRKSAPQKPSVQELALWCVEDISGNWEKFARNNRLNDFFVSSVPSWGDSSVNYLEDLNALVGIEKKIGLSPQVISPGFSSDNALGWVSAFRMNGIVVATPFMVSEQHARCFNVLLFLKFKRELVTNGITVTI